jgi:hypothetical protein
MTTWGALVQLAAGDSTRRQLRKRLHLLQLAAHGTVRKHVGVNIGVEARGIGSDLLQDTAWLLADLGADRCPVTVNEVACDKLNMPQICLPLIVKLAFPRPMRSPLSAGTS